jgi:predicted small lipoprotein YifL
MTIDIGQARLVLVSAALLSLGACGQTGALVLPGAEPAQDTQEEGAASEAEDQEEDESDQ